MILIILLPMTNLEKIDKDLNDSKFYELCSIMGKAIPKINTSILTKRLKELVDKWFITKTKKSEYHLSEQWKELMEWLKSLRERVIETGRDKKVEKYRKIS